MGLGQKCTTRLWNFPSPPPSPTNGSCGEIFNWPEGYFSGIVQMFDRHLHLNVCKYLFGNNVLFPSHPTGIPKLQSAETAKTIQLFNEVTANRPRKLRGPAN